MFLDHPKGIKAYKFWCLEPGHRKCIISWDVVFNKAKMTYIDKTGLRNACSKQKEMQKIDEYKLEVESSQLSESDRAGSWLLEEDDKIEMQQTEEEEPVEEDSDMSDYANP